MASALTEGVYCEKCGQDEGVRYDQLRTGEASFGCGNCRWYWEESSRRFGAATLAQLKEVVGEEGKPEWEAVDVLLTSLARECREHGYNEKTSTLEDIERLLETPHGRRTTSDIARVRELAGFKVLFELADGEVVFDYVERKPAPGAQTGSLDEGQRDKATSTLSHRM